MGRRTSEEERDLEIVELALIGVGGLGCQIATAKDHVQLGHIGEALQLLDAALGRAFGVQRRVSQLVDYKYAREEAA